VNTYVVTGAASGIGAAAMALLESQAHRVIGVDLRGSDVDADLSTAAGRDHAVRTVGELAPDGIDGLVPCAGLAGLTGVDSATLVSVNFFGAIALVNGLKPLLEMGGESAIVLLSSNSVTCQPGWNADVTSACLAGDEVEARALAAKVDAVQVYPSTKSALAYWCRREGVKQEWAGKGIRINAVAPGMIATPMTEALRKDPQLGIFADAYPTALGRPGEPEEIAALISFLLSDASSLMVGSIVFADGGTDALINPMKPEGMDVPKIAIGLMNKVSGAATKIRAVRNSTKDPQ
jgi:NAD(P)-dependent dehydrogenase (short-subunit alcohol dehydrogenase family)